jgi:hypothetical protein
LTAARLVARYLVLGHHPDALIATLSHAVLREDAGFHTFQMLEAGVRQFGEWGNTDEGRHILIGVARYLAAHSPTERAAYQTADVARRLMRGGQIHEQADEADSRTGGEDAACPIESVNADSPRLPRAREEGDQVTAIYLLPPARRSRRRA